MYCLFISSEDASSLATPPCRRALLFSPGKASDPFLDDGAPPRQVVQFYFDSLGDLEAAAAALAPRPSLVAEAMSVQRFDVPDRALRTADGSYCTYLVAYEGPAEDEAAWHAFYLADHPPLMARLPGIRELEVYLPLEWRCPAGLRRVRHLQRNKVAFDSPEALTAALNSPIRREMRAGFAKLPAFSGRVTHYAMRTTVLR